MTEQVVENNEIHNDCGVSCLPAFFGSLERKLDSPLLQRAFDELKANPSAFVSVGEWAKSLAPQLFYILFFKKFHIICFLDDVSAVVENT